MKNNSDDEEVTDEETIAKLQRTLDQLMEDFNKSGLAEYIEAVRSPRRMIYINFLAGLARGLGVIVGMTLLGAIFLSLLFRMAELNLPLIGEYIARIVIIVQRNL